MISTAALLGCRSDDDQLPQRSRSSSPKRAAAAELEDCALYCKPKILTRQILRKESGIVKEKSPGKIYIHGLKLLLGLGAPAGLGTFVDRRQAKPFKCLPERVDPAVPAGRSLANKQTGCCGVPPRDNARRQKHRGAALGRGPS